jgi:hypothetical protein
MAKKKKVKKVKKVAKKAVKKVKKLIKAKKVIARKKVVKKLKVKAVPKEQVLGKVDHYFDKISVAAIKVKGPFKVGDVIHVKGHTTDFVQKIASMQIDHREVAKVKKGDDVGMKVRAQVRENDVVYLAGKESAARLDQLAIARPVTSEARSFIVQEPLSARKPQALYQTSIFSAEKSLTKPVVKPSSQPSVAPQLPPQAAPALQPEKKKKDPYSETKFFNF